jgi:hypothetical protein
MAKYEWYDPIATTAKLRQKTGGRAWMRDLFALNAFDITKWEDNFLGDALRGEYSATATGVDGSHDKVAGSLNGESTLDVGAGTAADDEYGGLPLGLEWAGDNNAIFCCRLKLSAITTVKVEVGFTDALADAGAVATLATPSFTATDCAVWVFDRDDTATWQGVGAKAGTAPTKIEDSDIAAPVAGTYQTMIVQLQGDAARFIQLNANHELIYESAWVANAIEGGTKVTPWVFIQNRASQARSVTMDYFNCYQSNSSA